MVLAHNLNGSDIDDPWKLYYKNLFLYSIHVLYTLREKKYTLYIKVYSCTISLEVPEIGKGSSLPMGTLPL